MQETGLPEGRDEESERLAMRTVGEVADLTGVTIDALRKYDRIGLLRPRMRSSGGYRLYGHEELVRLREILAWRALGFRLSEIAALIDDPDHDRREAVRRQRELAVTQGKNFESLARGLDLALDAIEAGCSPVSGAVSIRTDPGRGRLRPFALVSGRSPNGTAAG